MPIYVPPSSSRQQQPDSLELIAALEVLDEQWTTLSPARIRTLLQNVGVVATEKRVEQLKAHVLDLRSPALAELQESEARRQHELEALRQQEADARSLLANAAECTRRYRRRYRLLQQQQIEQEKQMRELERRLRLCEPRDGAARTLAVGTRVSLSPVGLLADADFAWPADTEALAPGIDGVIVEISPDHDGVVLAHVTSDDPTRTGAKYELSHLTPSTQPPPHTAAAVTGAVEDDSLFDVEAEHDFDATNANHQALKAGKRYKVITDVNGHGWYQGRPADAAPGGGPQLAKTCFACLATASLNIFFAKHCWPLAQHWTRLG